MLESDQGFLSVGERGSLLAELRRRLAEIEIAPVRAVTPAPAPWAPAWAVAPKTPRRRIALADLPGARIRDGIGVVTTRYDASHTAGGVAPADALVTPPAVLAALAQVRADPDLARGIRFLDCETTGLAGGAGTLAFIIGVAWFEDDGSLVVEQLILSSPADEPELLDLLSERLAGGTMLVTFNGRTFDGPLLRTRHVLARRPPGPLATLPHLDLLPIARRLWRARSENCRQLTLERTILGQRRVDDMPGSMAPAAYAAWLQTGDASALEDIVRHNRDDVVGMAALLAAALRVLEAPETWAEDAREEVAVGEEWLRRGQPARAATVLTRVLAKTTRPELGGSSGSARRGADGPLMDRALRQLARAQRQSGDVEAARMTWRTVRAERAAASVSMTDAHQPHITNAPTVTLSGCASR